MNWNKRIRRTEPRDHSAKIFPRRLRGTEMDDPLEKTVNVSLVLPSQTDRLIMTGETTMYRPITAPTPDVDDLELIWSDDDIVALLRRTLNSVEIPAAPEPAVTDPRNVNFFTNSQG